MLNRRKKNKLFLYHLYKIRLLIFLFFNFSPSHTCITSFNKKQKNVTSSSSSSLSSNCVIVGSLTTLWVFFLPHHVEALVAMGYNRQEIEASLSQVRYDDVFATYLLLGRKSTDVSRAPFLLNLASTNQWMVCRCKSPLFSFYIVFYVLCATNSKQ